jgi:hypothetical protein
MQIAGIIIYLGISGYITVYVGQVLYKNGRHFIQRMLEDENLTDSVNQILLAGYYLVNLGYVSTMLTLRQPANTIAELIASLSVAIGRIVLTLGLMHYFNVAAIVLYNKLNITKKSTI